MYNIARAFRLDGNKFHEGLRLLKLLLQALGIHWRHSGRYHSFRNHYILIRKPLNHVTATAENHSESLRAIISCNCILLENKETVTVILITSEDP